MPALKNARHEVYAQGMASGKTASEALRDAGYTDPRNSTRLTKNNEIASRIDELRNRAAIKVDVTIESLAKELEEARSIAVKEKQTSAAVQATMGKAKLFGLGVEHRRLSGSVQIITLSAKDLDGLSPDEFSCLERAYPVLQKLGLVGGDPGPASQA